MDRDEFLAHLGISRELIQKVTKARDIACDRYGYEGMRRFDNAAKYIWTGRANKKHLATMTRLSGIAF